jgi:crotonobetainyl-CoA:carnitine CoA-transferase CaiB-like acyl-CoA transferase
VFRCADLTAAEIEEGRLSPGAEQDWVAVSVRDDADWSRLVAVVGAPAWAGDGLATTDHMVGARPASRIGASGGAALLRAERLARRAELEEWLGRWTATQTATAVAERLQAAGVPAARLVHPRTLLADEHEQARDFFVELEQPGIGPMTFEGPPFRGPALGEPIETPAPWPGQHTRAVCHDWLGLSDAEIGDLLSAGVLEEHEG